MSITDKIDRLENDGYEFTRFTIDELVTDIIAIKIERQQVYSVNFTEEAYDDAVMFKESYDALVKEYQDEDITFIDTGLLLADILSDTKNEVEETYTNSIELGGDMYAINGVSRSMFY